MMIKLWNYSHGKLYKTLHGHNNEINSVIISQNSKYIASGGDDKLIMIWGISNYKRFRML